MSCVSPEHLRAIKTLPQLLAYLRDELDWPVESLELDELTFDWSADQLLVSDSQARRLTAGVIRQLRPLTTGQPWGIFIVEFADDTFRRGALREILRGLVANRRRDPALPAWQHENLLFICATRDYDQITFAHYRGEKAQKARLALFGWQCGSSYLRTLCEFNLPALRWPEDPADASSWLKQWASAFDKEPLTKEFYREISNWYFWAREHAVFPDHPSNIDADGKPSLPLIRLLTRLIFCWFLREKRNPQTGTGMIPDALFDFRQIKDLLKDPSAESCTYYTAILQNLFFATLNTEMDKPGQPPARRFLDEGDGQRSDEHMVHQLWRHARQLRDPAALEKLLRDIPFLNGGLFECLDDRTQKGSSPYLVEVRIDGFATDPKKQPKLPNYLFYGAPQEADLSDAYGDSVRRRETVRPLLDILNRYNFTLTENTPFDQEVALDPELLGHVFENLLAAYNPETGVVARKATGSFYTPRVIVDWMVDQALMVYLEGALGDDGVGQTILSAASPIKPFNPDAVRKTRRHLPHWTQSGVTYWVTFRLADSLPTDKVAQWEEEKAAWVKQHLEPWSEKDWDEYEERFGKRFEAWLDAGHGECHLARPDVRKIVDECLIHFDGERYDVLGYVVMPNHFLC